MRVLMTGATGYIGKRIARHLLLNGHEVVCASRSHFPALTAWVYFDLDTCTVFTMPDGVDVVLHLAVNSALRPDGLESELLAARVLIDAATTRGIQVVFASSQAAREDAPTEYGRTKWHIEKEVLAANGIVVRLGQVYGGTEDGLFGSMVSICRKLPLLPAFLPAPLIQPIHINDCAQAFVTLAEAKSLPARVYSLGARVPVGFTEFLRAISTDWLRQPRLFFPIPVVAVQTMLRMLGPGFCERTRLGQLNSLFGLHAMETSSDLADLGLELRPLSAGMHRSGAKRRRQLAREATALLGYVLKEAPEFGLIRRYVRLIEALRGGIPLNLPAWLTRYPIALALLDTPTQSASPASAELSWRLHAAVSVAEASVQGAKRFLTSGIGSGLLSSIFAMSWAIAAELFWRIFSLFLRPFLKAAMNDSAPPR